MLKTATWRAALVLAGITVVPATALADNESWLERAFKPTSRTATATPPRRAPATAPTPTKASSGTSIGDLIASLTGGEYSVSPACSARAEPYLRARATFRKRADRYWAAVSRKRTLRKQRRSRGQAIRLADYVTSHPPKYRGPGRPKCLDANKPKRPPKPSTIGTVKDFLAAAKKHYGFVPRDTNETGFKTAYAREALKLGLTESQVIGVYALETGGIGPYFRQSGIFPVDQKCRPIKERGRPASTALGYAQLLAANSAVMADKKGPEIMSKLRAKARDASPERRAELLKKAEIVGRMRADVRRGIRRYRNRNNWREYVQFSKTEIGYAVHALNLDADIGPMMQVKKLHNIVRVAERKGLGRISGAQLELMNLAGYGRGLEMMTRAGSRAPTSNFFSRAAYRRNPVVKNRTGGELLKKIDEIIKKRSKNCGAIQFKRVFRKVQTAANR